MYRTKNKNNHFEMIISKQKRPTDEKTSKHSKVIKSSKSQKNFDH